MQSLTCVSCGLGLAAPEGDQLAAKCPKCGTPLAQPHRAPLGRVVGGDATPRPSTDAGQIQPASGSTSGLTAKSSWRIRAGSPTGGALRRIARFEVTDALGKGAFGEVWRAYDPNLDREVALKVPRFDDATGREAERFFREARAAAQLHHPNIVAIHDAGDSDGQFYIASELIEGMPLSVWLRENTPSFEQTAQIIRKLAEALHYAHTQGIYHRDIKPANVMIDAAGEPHLMDFGLARRPDQEATMTMDGALVGTPSYMSPEQAGGKGRQADARSDLYSLGVVLYEMLAGRKPFDGPPPVVMHKILTEEPEAPRKINSKVPCDLETICLKCLAKEPQRRYPSAQHLAEELERWLRDEPIQTRPIRTPERLWRWCRRNPTLATISTASVLVITIVVFIAFINIAAERDHALNQEAIAQSERSKADSHRLQAESMSAGLMLDRAISLCEYGDVTRGMHTLVEALRLAKKVGDQNLENAVRANLANWARDILPIVSHLDGIDLAFSPGGKRLMTGSRESFRLFDTETWQMHGQEVPLKFWPVDRASFSPDGAMFTTMAGTELQFRDSATAKIIASVSAPGGRTRPRWRITRSGEILMISEDGILKSWKPGGTRRDIARLGMPAGIDFAEFDRDGKEVVTVSKNMAQFWDVASQKPLGSPFAHSEDIASVALSPDGRLIFLGGARGTGQLWDRLAAAKKGPAQVHREGIGRVVFSPDSKVLITGSMDQTVRIWDVATGKPIGHPIYHPIKGLDISPDGRVFATGDQLGIVRVFDLGHLELGHELVRHSGEVTSLALSHDGRLLATGSKDKSARLWDAVAGKPIGKPMPHQDPVSSVAFHPDDKTLATGGGSLPVITKGETRIWNVPSTTPACPPFPSEWGVFSLSYADGGKTLLVGGGNFHKGFVQPLDSRSGKSLGTALEFRPVVFTLTCHSDGQRFLIGGYDYSVQMYDTRTLKPVLPTMQHHAAVRAVAFSPDGKSFLTGSWDRTAQLWNTGNGQRIAAPFQHQGVVNCVAWRPDGNSVATGCDDGTVRLWDVATGKTIGPPLKHPGNVTALAFSTDGKRLLSGCADGVVRVWDLVPPTAKDTDQLALWVQVITGTEVDSTGTPQRLDVRAWQERYSQLHQRNGVPNRGISSPQAQEKKP